MNDCTFIVVRVAASIRTTPASTAGTVEMTTKASRSDWKLAASRRKITTTATASPAAIFLSVSRIGAISPRTRNRRPARRRARPGNRPIDARGGAAEIFAGDVGGQRHHALAVEAVVFAHDGAVLNRGDVAQQRMRCAAGRYGHDAEIIEARHPRLRDLDLDLKRDTGARIGPEVRCDEPARRGRRGKRLTDLVHSDPELASELTIDVDVDGGVVERLLDLQIAERRNLRELVLDFARERTRRREVGTDDRDLHGRWRTEVHDPAHDVARLERELCVGKLPGKAVPKVFFEIGEADGGVRL